MSLYFSSDELVPADGFYVDQHNAAVWHNQGELFQTCVWTDEPAVWKRYNSATNAS